ncbi:MAG: peptidase, partial [Chitinophagaceae bacterium]|nr:peptidase [Chitinophagaceae bacterium]
MRKIVFCFLAFLSIGTVYSQGDDSVIIKSIANEILVNGKAYDNLRYLTKQVGARLSGSAGMVKAEQWGLNAIKQAGADKSWMQECL